jgi:cell wall-associated NlpC family hydrolase
MTLLTRARTAALAGVTSLAVALPLAPMAVAPAAAAPAPGATVSAASAVSASTTTQVSAAERRKKKSSRSRRSFAARSKKVMRTGNNLKGVPYRYGGSTPRGFDCSGFTKYVYRKSGVRLPHSATAQMHKSRRISRSKARKGDLVFFRSGSRAYHVGIYAGKNRVLHSPRPGKRVHTTRIWTRNVTFGRVL